VGYLDRKLELHWVTISCGWQCWGVQRNYMVFNWSVVILLCLANLYWLQGLSNTTLWMSCVFLFFILFYFIYLFFFFFTFVGPYIVIYFYRKTNQMHNISNLFYFGTTLYIIQTVSPSIIRSLRLYIQHQVYVIEVLL
jgi:hypothetical protein